MKTRPLILSLALAAACTEPATLQQAFYEGTITERWTVVDTFQDTRTTTLTVRAQPNDPAPTCASSVRVTVSDSTMIAWSDAPTSRVSDAELVPPRRVRVSPDRDPRDQCPMQIDAMSITIMR